MVAHPILRFDAPRSIQTGSSLAALFDPIAIGLIGESFATTSPSFDVETFTTEAAAAAAGLPLKQRALAIARSLREHLPRDDHGALSALRASLGPELTRTEDNGLQIMFYMPHSALLEGFADTSDDGVFSAAIEANFELTTRFTAEFSIRPFLEARLDQTLEALNLRIEDPNPHVRRLISEGTRPRLPWARHLRAIRQVPELTLPLLTALRDDPVRYVTRSVANHLGDIGKDHPGLLLGTCGDWLDELDSGSHPAATVKERRWLIRHAVRHPAKKGDAQAHDLRRRAAA
jgi:3-methyladenine DNA glycosylase AlkC